MILGLAGVLFSSCTAQDDLFGTAASDIQASESRSMAIADENVALLRAGSFIHYRYGQSQYDRSFVIRVKNIAFDKVVGVHHETASGQWIDIPAEYQYSTADGFEIWRAGTGSLNQNDMGEDFVVFFTANGETYWDNNDGNNYTMVDKDGWQLGSGLNILQNTSYNSYNGGRTLTLDVRNLGYHKDIQVVYTTNNWASSNSVSATYQNGYLYGYSWTATPTQAGFEFWNATIPSGPGTKYFISYTIDGQTYYDNNFGQDYSY